MQARARELAAIFTAVACVCGCGARERQRVAPPPKLPQPLAASLAAQSDTIAQALSAGDSCGALALAQRLQQQTIAAINARHVAQPLQEPLLGSVNQLAAHIQCTAEPQEKEHRRHKNKHDQNQGEGGG